ncbi:APC family permease [Spirosoma endophyticum]|uniref:Amino acid/polyamine/organocation transporter, APC superfamily n=1 Tax=Spirosoma endophyticum TaxID=662367 RepID=A0A1I1FFN8_9BACT|nr:amino acid permease [Spirosoma endophyticum]SFB98227.1 amino acid/polyamine/organocation transporter, APC superfamily [Spirosoma endophyticum]
MDKLARTIELRPAILLVVSGIVGSGVFKKVAPMAAELGSPLLVLACWIVAGLISLAGALTYAEMAGMFPQSGGEYVYFKKVYGRLFAFLYGWGAFTVMRTATIAALAHIFGQSLISLTSLQDDSVEFAVKCVATLLITVLSLLNYRGVTFAEGFSRALIYLTFAAVAVIAVIGFRAETGSFTNLTQAIPRPGATSHTLVGSLVAASLGAFWGYEGWNQIGYIGEEVKNPQRNLPIALGVGTSIVVGIYVLLNVVYVYVLPISTLADLASVPGKIAGVEVVRQAAGWVGATFISVLILVTTSNSTNASILMPARVFYAMARDGLFFKAAAIIHPRYKTPSVAILLQSVWSVVLVWSGSFDQLTDMLVFASFIFYGATALGVILLRYKQPDLLRPYRTFGYPIVPAFFCACCALLVCMTLINQPREAITGLGLIATGLPFYWFWRKRSEESNIENPVLNE